MLPRFREGDFLLVSPLPALFGRVRVGDAVAFRQGEHGTMIKYVNKVLDNDHYLVRGTHPQSVDSRHFGPVSRSDLIGRVLWHLKKPAKNRTLNRIPAASADDNR
jgi:signal peptidase I